MIFRRLLLALMAAAVFSAGAAVAMFALAFALYALVEPRLGRAGAAATVALATALLMGLAGALLARSARRMRKKAASIPGGLIERALSFVQRKPILAASAAVGAGFMAVRNPKYLGEVLRAFFANTSDGV